VGDGIRSCRGTATGASSLTLILPDCFQAIVDYLNEMMISSEDSPPSPPSVDDEHEHILQYQLELFGLEPTVELPDSSIIKDDGYWKFFMIG
jgi:hypothetical protein